MNEEEIPEQVSEEIPEEIPEEPQGPDVLERAQALQRQYDLAQELRQKYKERQAKRAAAQKAGGKAVGEGETIQPGAAAAAKGGAPAEATGKGAAQPIGTKAAEQAGGQAAKEAGKEVTKKVGTEAAKTAGKQAGKEAGKTGAKGLLAASGLVSEGAGTAIAVAVEVADRAGQVAMKAISWIPGAKDFLTPAIAVILFIIALLALTAGPVFGFAAGLGAGEGGDEPINYPYLTNIDQILSYPATCDENRLAQVINDHIRNFYPKSEMQGLGRVFVAEGKETGINPIFIVALAEHESRFGTDAGNHRGPNHALKRSTTDVYNPFGRTATAQQPHINAGGRRWYAFNSWEEAIRLHGDYLRQRYFDRGFNTLPKLMTEYAPPGENDTNGYVALIITINQELLKEAGCQLNSATPADTQAINNNLTQQIKQLIQSSGFNQNDVGVYFVGSSQPVSINSTTLFPAASSIKAALLLAYLSQNNIPSGDNHEILRRTIVNSDNNQGNKVLDQLGGPAKATRIINSLGIQGVQINRRFGATAAKDNLMSPQGATQVLRAIEQLPQQKANYAQQLLNQGDAGTGEDYIRQALSGKTIYSKSGQCLNDACRNDIAIIGNNQYLAIMVKASGQANKAETLIRGVAQHVAP